MAAKVQVVNAAEIIIGGITVANGADTAEGTTTDAPVADNTTVASATAATGVALWKRLVNIGIAILAKLPVATAVTPHFKTLGASGSQVIPIGARGYLVTFMTGTGTIGGEVATAGLSVSSSNTLAVTVTITTDSASSAFVSWEI